MIVYGDNIYRTTDQVLYYGSNRIAKVYYGDSLIYPEPSGSGHYENIVIPAGNLVLTYTNKYDPSQTFTVYEFEPIDLVDNVTYPTSSSGGVCTGITDNLMSGKVSRSGVYRDYDSIIPKYTRNLFYMPRFDDIVDQVPSDDYDESVSILREVVDYLDNTKPAAAYRTSTGTQSYNGVVTDLFIYLTHYVVDQSTSLEKSVRLSSLVNVDFNKDSIFDLIEETYSSTIDRTKPLKFSCETTSCIVTIDNTEYVFNLNGTGAAVINKFYKIITSTGKLYYTPNNTSSGGVAKYGYLFIESPESDKPYINIDIDIYFNWEWSTSTLSQPITIRTWIPEYDEHGKPIEN